MKEYSKWKDAEVKKLFAVIEKTKSNNKSLLEGFASYAKVTKRKPNSVRNYYYQELSELSKDKKRAEKLAIDLSKHEVLHATSFSELDTEKLVTEILRLKCMGVSVRKACLKLANNNVNDMVRYQNKFRSVIQKDKVMYEKCLENLKKRGLDSKNIEKQQKTNNSNVIFMKKQEKKISEDEMNSLFLGLVKLVKKTAIENIEKELVGEMEFVNSTLRKTLVKLANAEKEMKGLEDQLNTQKQKNETLENQNFILNTKIAEIMGQKINKSKTKTLACYLREIKEKGQIVKTKI